MTPSRIIPLASAPPLLAASPAVAFHGIPHAGLIGPWVVILAIVVPLVCLILCGGRGKS